MSEHLSTGQMIDKLKVGEIAECVSDGFYEGSQLKRTSYDEIVFMDSRDFFKLTTFAYKAKWKIIPNPMMTTSVCANCKYIELYGDNCPVTDDDETEHFDDGIMYFCKCFKSIDATESA
jgi:hypothetical protein